MNHGNVIKWLGEPDAVLPAKLGMNSNAWLCSHCGQLHEFDAPVRPPAPCICGSVFFEKRVRTQH